MKDYDEAVKLYKLGLSTQDIGDLYGITRQAVNGLLRRRGVKLRNNVKKGKESHFYRGGAKSKDRVTQTVQRALKKGILNRPEECELCMARDVVIEAHHCDYSKPLDVMWLCRKCHYEWHKENKAKGGDND